MALIAPEEGFVWLQVPLHESIDVVVLGELHSWFTHWYRGRECRGSLAVRCVLEERGKCDWCRAGYEKRVRYVFPVGTEEGVRLVELGRVQYPALAAMMGVHDWVGSRLRMCRERPVKNAPIQVRWMGEERVPPEMLTDCGEVVRQLGLVNLRMLDNLGVLGREEIPDKSANGRSRT